MPESRKRPGHHHPQHHTTSVPTQPRSKGRIIWAILLGVFGLLIAFFAAGANYIALAAGALIGGLIGYAIGKSMEKEARKE
jgi:predicted phage tail protein